MRPPSACRFYCDGPDVLGGYSIDPIPVLRPITVAGNSFFACDSVGDDVSVPLKSGSMGTWEYGGD